MVRITDSTFTIRLEGVDLTQSTNIVFTIAQPTVKIDIKGDKITVVDAGKMIVSLSRYDTAKLRKGAAKIGVNGFDSNGQWATPEDAPASDVYIDGNLYGKVIENE